MSNSVNIAWRNPANSSWIVVGRLTSDSELYHFQYTKGASVSDFNGFAGMPDKHIKYSSKELFPIFKNRILPKRRPEYPYFLSWLSLTSAASDLEILAASGGTKQTDNVQVFKNFEVCPDDSFEYYFFVHGLSHLHKSAQEYVDCLKENQKLYLAQDKQNPHDGYAIQVQQRDPSHLLGYTPSYLSKLISILLNDSESRVNVSVEKISSDAPKNYRLLCRMHGTASKSAKQNIKSFEHLQPYS